jgi:Predicted hydrolase of the metallo-beta-lactamase superfamily
LSEDGIVLPILAINKASGKMETQPEIITRGFISVDEDDSLISEARLRVLRTIDESSVEERTDWAVIKEKIRTDLRRFLFKQTAKRPLVLPVILEI